MKETRGDDRAVSVCTCQSQTTETGTVGDRHFCKVLGS